MALIYIVNNTKISTADVIKKNSIEQKVNFNGQDLIAAKTTIRLDNTDRSKYDDQTAGSLFYGVSWYNAPVTIYDTDLGILTWVGRIKSIKVNDGEQSLEIESTNWLKDAVDTTCNYSANEITPMAAIEDIITSEDLVNIDAYWINKYTFNYTIGYQDSHSITVDINFTHEKNQNCLQVIEELCRISHSSIYLRNNTIYALQYEPFKGGQGTLIEERNLTPGSYRHHYDSNEIYTECHVRYKPSSGAVTLSKITESNDTGLNKGYPRKTWNIPDVDNGTNPEEYPIIINNATGAAWVVSTALERWSEPGLVGEFTIGEELEVIPGTQVDLNFRTFIREPILITGHLYNPARHEVTLTGIFRNLPVRKYSVDIDPPETPAIISVIYLSSTSWRILFTKCQDAESYEMYFTNSAGSWNTSFSDQGISHLEIKDPGITDDGFHFVDVTGLQPRLRYWYKTRAIDASLNPSAFSNVFEGLLILNAYENRYYLSGDVWTGISLDLPNSEKGSPPSSEVLYGAGIYGLDYYGLTAYYESPIYKLIDYSLLRYTGEGRLTIGYRSSTDNITWSSWSSDIKVNGEGALDVTPFNYFQFRVIFSSLTWDDPDNFQLLEIR